VTRARGVVGVLRASVNAGMIPLKLSF